MSSMIVARFDSIPSAKSAAHALIAEGFREEAIRLFRGGRHAGPTGSWEPPVPIRRWTTRYRLAWRTALLAASGTSVATLTAILATDSDLAVVGAAVLGACGGAAMGAWWAGRWLAAWRLAWLQSLRESGHGVLLAVQTEPEEEDAAVSLLRDAGGFQIDHEHGEWREGRWVECETVQRSRAARRPPVSRHTQWQL